MSAESRPLQTEFVLRKPEGAVIAFSSHNKADLEELLSFTLKRAGVNRSIAAAKALRVEISISIEIFLNQQKQTFKQGSARAALLKLWQSNSHGASAEALRASLTEMPLGALAYLEERASRILPKLGLGPVARGGLLGWAAAASDDDLRTMILHCAAEGRQFAEGRKRPNGKQSRGRIEPVILGVADRRTFSQQKNAPANDSADRIRTPVSNAGRSRIDDKVALISMLANDWYRATGSLQIGGRSDENPFNDFVISVFEWADISGSENALRVFWAEMKERKARSAPDIGSPPKDD